MADAGRRDRSGPPSISASHPRESFGSHPSVLDDFDLSALEGDNEDALMRAFFGSIAARDRACAALALRFREQRASFDPIDVPDEDWAAESQRGAPRRRRSGGSSWRRHGTDPLSPDAEDEPI